MPLGYRQADYTGPRACFLTALTPSETRGERIIWVYVASLARKREPFLPLRRHSDRGRGKLLLRSFPE